MTDQQPKAMDITDLQNAVKAAAELGTTVADVVASGKPSIGSVLTHLPELMTALKDAGNVDYTKIVPEAESLTADEATALAQTFQTYFHTTNTTVEAIVAEAVQVVGWVVQAVQIVSNIIKSLQPKA